MKFSNKPFLSLQSIVVSFKHGSLLVFKKYAKFFGNLHNQLWFRRYFFLSCIQFHSFCCREMASKSLALVKVVDEEMLGQLILTTVTVFGGKFIYFYTSLIKSLYFSINNVALFFYSLFKGKTFIKEGSINSEECQTSRRKENSKDTFESE